MMYFPSIFVGSEVVDGEMANGKWQVGQVGEGGWEKFVSWAVPSDIELGNVVHNPSVTQSLL